MRRALYYFLPLFLAGVIGCSGNGTPASPNGKIALDYSEGSFQVHYLKDGTWTNVLSISGYGVVSSAGKGRELTYLGMIGSGTVDVVYDMHGGKASTCDNRYREYVYSFSDEGSRPVRICFRLYDDGIAFRYDLDGLETEMLPEELTEYAFPRDSVKWMMKYNAAYEDLFPSYTVEETPRQHTAYPMLFRTLDDVWGLITEGGIESFHAASSLDNEEDDGRFKVHVGANHLSINGQWTSPWRLVILGDLSDIVESTLVTDVSDPCKIADTGWIHPGVASWVYWANNHGSKDFQIVKSYIDLAATLKLPYVLIDWEWDVMGNGGNLDDAIAYADEKGVRALLWYNSSTAWVDDAAGPLFRLNTPEAREKEFSWLESKGIAGVKVDFFDGDTQETMSYCIDILEDAARHHLLVNFHGATIPRGWQRTYPNLMSTEGVYGAEWYNNTGDFTDKAARHNATLPFTRNVVGPMDYTPCAFSNSQHPHITSSAHELALTVLFESSIQHLADRPESFLAQPQAVQDFLSVLPSFWDETKLLSGYPGESVVIARRKGNQWFVAGINGTDEARVLELGDFGNRDADYRLFEDDGHAGWKINDVKGTIPETVACEPRGGFVMVI